jgi:hypothetical protein
MHYEITASQQAIRKNLSTTQRMSSLYSDSPRIGTVTLRRGQVLRLSVAEHKYHQAHLDRLIAAGAITVVAVNDDTDTQVVREAPPVARPSAPVIVLPPPPPTTVELPTGLTQVAPAPSPDPVPIIEPPPVVSVAHEEEDKGSIAARNAANDRMVPEPTSAAVRAVQEAEDKKAMDAMNVPIVEPVPAPVPAPVPEPVPEVIQPEPPPEHPHTVETASRKKGKR